MTYERSLAIEQRLGDVLELIRTGQCSTPDIAERLGVSVPTISRDVNALRERGHSIRAVRQKGGWRYFIDEARQRQTATSNSSQGRRKIIA